MRFQNRALIKTGDAYAIIDLEILHKSGEAVMEHSRCNVW